MIPKKFAKNKYCKISTVKFFKKKTHKCHVVSIIIDNFVTGLVING